ncbi:NAD(+) diphosphatase [Novispirillum itersonii]|uniref:NAD(+) diphosphatase n=1 Tax=Novispirillum itersonii TaxID=189 RepID=UPI0003761D47|nr:NAD(+) diphosphatase [Novispirillum itersonii]
MLPRPLAYAQAPIDRAHHLRSDPAHLATLWSHPDARVLMMWGGKHLTTADAAPLPLPPTAIGPTPEQSIFLGLEGTIPVFAHDWGTAEEEPTGTPQDAVWRDLRENGPDLSGADASQHVYARGLILWHRRTNFCSVCGSGLTMTDGGHVRRCNNADCGASHFPRTDPAVIMLVTDGKDRVLLGRQASWAPGAVSTLAGFVEPGETLEQAVAREVFEEAGIHIAEARYIASQPWPFPGSLMVGFEAVASSETITVDPKELESARWFHRDEIKTFRDGWFAEGEGWALPRQDSISRFLILSWLHRPT